ncbi:MAG: hypothetical protein ICV73_08045 [Acetobacteraceae bacterium]|nr:hypothetical protein [Acetobacteraceae bacterium]
MADALTPPGKAAPGLADALTQPGKAIPGLIDGPTQPGKAVPNLADALTQPGKAVPGLIDGLTPLGKAGPGLVDGPTQPGKAVPHLAEGLVQSGKAEPGSIGSLDHPTKIIPGLADGPTQPGKAVPHLAEGLVQPGKAEPNADAPSEQPAKAAPSILADVPAEPSKTLPHSDHETAIASSKGPVRQEADAHPPPDKAVPALGDPVVDHPKESTHASAADPQPGKPAAQNADVPPAAHAHQDLAPGAVAAGGGKAEPGSAHTDPTLHFSDLWQPAGGKSEPAQTHTFVPDKAALGAPAETLVLDVQTPVADGTPNRAAPVKQDAGPPGGGADHDVPALVAPSGKVGAWDEALAPFAASGPGKHAGPHAADLPHGPDDAHGGIGSGLHGNGASSLTHDLALL